MPLKGYELHKHAVNVFIFKTYRELMVTTKCPSLSISIVFHLPFYESTMETCTLNDVKSEKCGVQLRYPGFRISLSSGDATASPSDPPKDNQRQRYTRKPLFRAFYRPNGT